MTTLACAAKSPAVSATGTSTTVSALQRRSSAPAVQGAPQPSGGAQAETTWAGEVGVSERVHVHKSQTIHGYPSVFALASIPLTARVLTDAASNSQPLNPALNSLLT